MSPEADAVLVWLHINRFSFSKKDINEQKFSFSQLNCKKVNNFSIS